MNARFTSTLVIFVAVGLVMAAPAAALADDAVAEARDLYVAAAYDDALAVLNRLREGQHAPEEGRSIELYRALCFLALGRTVDADRAMEIMVAEDPTYRPSDGDMPPRVRAAFSDVRRRTLPTIIQQRYTQAKAAFEHEEYAAAAAGFKQVLDGLADPDVASAATQPPLADLRTLAAGFRDLSAKAAAPPPQRPLAPERPPAPLPPPLPVAPPRPVALRVYGAEDAGVVLPAALRQSVPPFPGQVVMTRTGVVEVVIDETGAVESATIKVPLDVRYDAIILSAAKTWRYQPATIDGVPIKFRKIVQIVLKPGT